MIIEENVSVTIIFTIFIFVYFVAFRENRWYRNKPLFVNIIYLFLIIASVFSPIGGDKRRYITSFHDAPFIEYIKDPGWVFLTKVLNMMCFDNEILYLFIIAFLYVLGYYLIGRYKIGKQHLTYFLLLSAGCLGFWSGATNIMRAGLATSIFLVALCFEKKVWLYVALIISAFLIHNSLLILVVGFVLTKYYRKYNVYCSVWGVFLVLSSVNALDFITSFLSEHMGEVGDRIAEYAYSQDSQAAELYKNAGFRWDFVGYSAFAILYSRWIIVKQKYKDIFYERISCTYIIANCFWLVMIRAFYGDRFALLSWSLLPLIVLYPYMHPCNRLPFNKKAIVAAFLPVAMNFVLAMRSLF